MNVRDLTHQDPLPKVANRKSAIGNRKFHHSLYGVPSDETSPEALWTFVTPCSPEFELGSSPLSVVQSFWPVIGSVGISRIYSDVMRSSSDCGSFPLSAAYWSRSLRIVKRSSRSTVSRACVIVF